MVSVRSGEADAFVRKPPAGVSIFLIFGQDAGAVSERASALARGFADPAGHGESVIRLEADALARDPALLVDEAQTVGLFGGRRCIRVDARSKNIVPAVQRLMEEKDADYKLIIEAGELRRDAPLRRLLEREASAALIECWPDTLQQVERLIDERLGQDGIAISPGGRQLLAGFLGADRLATRSEIDKLALYAHGRATIGEEDVAAIASDAAAVVIDQLIDAAFSGDRTGVTVAGPRVFEDIDAGVVLSFALRQALLLLQVALDMAKGASAEAAVERQVRGAPPRRRAQLTALIRRWTPESLALLAKDLGEAVGRVRLNPRLADAIAQRMLWEIARRAIRP